MKNIEMAFITCKDCGRKDTYAVGSPLHKTGLCFTCYRRSIGKTITKFGNKKRAMTKKKYCRCGYSGCRSSVDEPCWCDCHRSGKEDCCYTECKCCDLEKAK